MADSYRQSCAILCDLCLGHLNDFKDSENDRVEYSDMPELERWVLHRLAELDLAVQ